jgi:hypothetical protein
MNQETNNDIDILLRRLSRQDEKTRNPTQDGQHAGQQHLDADELNSYAENAMPSALRARYTEHLAECTSCRKVVTQLSLASGIVVPARVEEAKPSAPKTFLAGLFSPLVFRYAVPAMAIVVVVAIAWVALQRRSPLNQIAQNASKEASAPAPAATPAEGEMSARNSPGVGLTGTGNETKDSRSRAGEKSAESRESSDVKQEEAIAEDKKLAAATVDELRDREELAKRNEPQPVAPAPASAGATVATTVSPKRDDVAERKVEVAQKKESEADKNKAMNEPPSSGGRAATGQKRSGDFQSLQRAPTDSASSRRARGGESTAKDEAEAGEVRTVGGHRFRKQGEVWIDALYSSQSTTNVSRGSEQYRALVADEPGIGSIAEQLKAEFIVVWKGRAYRIR